MRSSERSHRAEQRAGAATALEEDYEHLGRQLARRGVDIEALVGARGGVPRRRAVVGRRHRRHALRALPRAGRAADVFEKLEDCGVVQALVRVTPGISLHIPWDKPRERPGDAASVRADCWSAGCSSTR